MSDSSEGEPSDTEDRWDKLAERANGNAANSPASNCPMELAEGSDAAVQRQTDSQETPGGLNVQSSCKEVDASALASSLTTQHHLQGNHQLQLNINDPMNCPTNIAGTINNDFKVKVVNRQRIKNVQVNRNKQVNFVTNNYATASHYISSTEADTELEFSCDEDNVTREILTETEFHEVLKTLDGKGRVLLSAPPGPKRAAYMSAIRQHYKEQDYTVFSLSSVKDWGKKAAKSKHPKQIVVIDWAFGAVRLDQEQYHSFFNHTMYRHKSSGTKIVFLVFPHIFAELQQFDKAIHQPILKSVQVVILPQEPPFSFKHYHRLFLRFLHDYEGEAAASLFVLALRKFYQETPDQDEDEDSILQSFGFQQFSPAYLRVHATLLTGFLFTDDGETFSDRVFYDAAAIALGSTGYLHHKHLLQIIDSKFFVEFVRTASDPDDESSHLLKLHPDNKHLFMQTVFNSIVGDGLLPEIVQHPTLYNPDFLQEFTIWLETDGRMKSLINAVDNQYGLSLVYWSIWGPACYLTVWCFRDMSNNYYREQCIIKATFAFALMKRSRREVDNNVWNKLRHKARQYFKTARVQSLILPLIPEEATYSDRLESFHGQLNDLCQSPLWYLGQPCLAIHDILLKVDMFSDEISVTFPCQQPYLALRLLTDREVDEQDEDGNTVLHLAAATDKLQAVKLAVNSGASLTIKNKAGLTPPQLAASRLKREDHSGQSDVPVNWPSMLFNMYFACSAGDTGNMVKMFLCHSSTVDDRDPNNMTFLHYACKSGQVETVALLINTGADVNATDRWNQTPLHIACMKSHVETALLLISKGANVNFQTNKGMSPLHVACQNGDRHLAEMLINRGVDINLRCSTGHTALAVACDNSHWGVAELLLQHQASIDGSLSINYDFTLLHKACFEGQYELAKFLLTHNARANLLTGKGWKERNRNQVVVKDRRRYKLTSKGWKKRDGYRIFMGNRRIYILCDQETALHLATYKGHTDIVKLLVSHGASVNTKNEAGITALHHACFKGDINIVHILLHENADVNATDRRRHTPLYVACRENHQDTALLLINKGADVNLQTNKGIGPLHAACQHRNRGLAKILINHGAKVMRHTVNGLTPLVIACENNNWEVAELLLALASISETSVSKLLYDACYRGWYRLAEFLLKQNFEFVVHPDNFKIHLAVACESSHWEISELLLQHHVNIDASLSENYVFTLLHKACFEARYEMAKFLLTHDARADKLTSKGWKDRDGDRIFMGNRRIYRLCDQETALHLATYKGHTDIVKLLVSHGASVNTKNEAGITALHHACFKGDINIVHILLHENADVNATDRWNDTPLHVACRKNHMITALLLISKGANVNFQTNKGMSPLHVACQNGDRHLAEMLINRGADINLRCSTGHTALAVACDNSHWGVAELLLQHQASIDGSLSINYDFTLLHKACFEGQYELAKFLLRHTPRLDMPTSKGWRERDGDRIFRKNKHRYKVSDQETALHLACYEGHADIAKLLVNHGASVSLKNGAGACALHVACYNGNAEIVRELLFHIDDVNLKDEDSWTPLIAACVAKKTEIVSLLLQKDDVSANECDRHGLTPLHLACITGQTEIVRLLLKHRADVNVRDIQGMTPLLKACEKGSTDIMIQILLQNKADVSLSDASGETALHKACKEGRSTVVRLLLQHDAGINVTDERCWTPLHVACQNGNAEVVQLLLEEKPDIRYINSGVDTAMDVAKRAGHQDVVDIIQRYIRTNRSWFGAVTDVFFKFNRVL